MLKVDGRPLAAALLIVGAMVMSLLVPFSGPIVGSALMLGGLAALRKGEDQVMRTIGFTTIGSGIVILLIGAILITVFFGVSLKSVTMGS